MRLAQFAVAADLTCSTAARGNLSMLDIHHRPRKRDASETGVRRCIGFVLSKNLSPVRMAPKEQVALLTELAGEPEQVRSLFESQSTALLID